jgi:hypothetical protein
VCIFLPNCTMAYRIDHSLHRIVKTQVAGSSKMVVPNYLTSYISKQQSLPRKLQISQIYLNVLGSCNKSGPSYTLHWSGKQEPQYGYEIQIWHSTHHTELCILSSIWLRNVQLTERKQNTSDSTEVISHNMQHMAED